MLECRPEFAIAAHLVAGRACLCSHFATLLLASNLKLCQPLCLRHTIPKHMLVPTVFRHLLFQGVSPRTSPVRVLIVSQPYLHDHYPVVTLFTSAPIVHKYHSENLTCAALAAAALGPSVSRSACASLPKGCPPWELFVFGGAAARALSGCGGAVAGCAPSVRPSPWKFEELLVPSPPLQQLPMTELSFETKNSKWTGFGSDQGADEILGLLMHHTRYLYGCLRSGGTTCSHITVGDA